MFLDNDYKPIAPNEQAEEIDATIVSRMKCKTCKGTMRYEPYYNKETGSYIAYAVCNKCGRKVEF